MIIAAAVCIMGAGMASSEPTEQWNKTFGGTFTELGFSVQQTSDGGYILVGYTTSYGAGGFDVYLVKTDSTGNMQWNKTFGGLFRDMGMSVQQTLDGGYIIAGLKDLKNDGIGDALLIKTDSNGVQEWNRTFGEPNHHDWANCVKQTSDGGYILTGVTSSYDVGSGEVWLIKTNSTGIQIWNKTFGGLGSDWANSVEQTIDGGYILTGYTATNQDALLIKTDSNGNLEWEKTFGGTDIYQANSVQQTTEGGYILGGHIDSRGAGIDDAWLIKTDSNGDQQWNKTFGGAYDDRIVSIRQTLDGGYILAGWTNLKGAVQEDAWLIKTDSNGFQQWEMTFGMSNERGHSVQQTSDGGYILAGETWANGLVYSDAWLIKVSSESVNSGPVHNINKGTHYTTIQAAIDDATPGDEIHVDSGTYYENVVVNKQLILQGESNLTTIIDGNLGDFVVEVIANEVVIEGFKIQNGIYGIYITSSNNTLISNTVSSYMYGVLLQSSNNNTLIGNTASNNKCGISLQFSKNNTLISNIASNNINGISLQSSNNNTLISNTASNNNDGITLDYSSNNTLSNNIFINDGLLVEISYKNNIVENTVNNKPLVYFENKSDIVIQNAGQVILVNSNNITVEGLKLSNTSPGIELWNTRDCTIINNIVSNNEIGIILGYSNNNTLSGNTVSNNEFGIWLYSSNNNNILYHNNLVDNQYNALDNNVNNQWDWGTTGNYYSDYTGTDSNGDGIGDTPYPIQGGSSVDNYPLMVSYSPPSSDYEGKLLKQTGDFKVYLIEDGKKRHFTSPEALEWNGHSFDDVIEVSVDVINSFELGADINITQAIIDKYNVLGGEAIFGPPAGTGEQTGYPDNAGVICTYVNFQNGAIEYFTNGDQAGNAYAILNISDMSDTQSSSFGTSFKYQNFMNGTERGALEYNLSSGEVFEIHGAIYAKWEEKGFAGGIMGLLTGDEKEAGKSPYGTTGRYSEFENGHIHWISDVGDYNAGKIYRGKAFATYGDLDWFYTNDGGTNGKLGFPVMDKYETTTYGHGECVFEGGKIIWDDYRGLHEIIYHGYLPDLTITDISFSKENPAEGEPITIYATVKNVGYTDAIGEIAVKFSQQSYYEDFEGDEFGNKYYIGVMVRENLGAGESSIVSMTWNVAPVFSVNPKGFINVEVDSSKKIEETNENNNVEWGKVTISSRSNFKPEIDGYHFKNFPLTDAEIDKMIAEIGIWYDDDFYAVLLPKENLDVLLKELFSKSANCYGMSASSTLYYHQLVPKPEDKDTFDLSKTDEVKQKIYDYQVMQAPYILDEVLRILFQDVVPIWHHDVKIEYNIIKYHIENDKPIISNINYFYKDEYTLLNRPDARHALTPFNTYDVSENIKNVLVYDSNHPGMATVVQFDFDNNKITYNDFDEEYMLFGRYSSTKYPLMTMDDAKNTFFDILKEFKKAFIKQLHDSKSKYLIFKCPIDITIIDQYGHIIDNKGKNEIPGAKVNIVGDLKMFLLPADLDYTIKIDAYDSGDFTFTQINPLTSEYASLISFVEVPITENTEAISEVSSANPEYKIKIDYDGDGIIDETIKPEIIDIIGANFYDITFLPPIITKDQYNLKDGSTLPIKFTARNNTTDEFIYDDTVNVSITNSTGHLITYFTHGKGTDSVRINSEEEQYIVNFHSKNYDLNVGETYSITVTFGEQDSLRGYEITYFTLVDKGKGKKK